MKHWNMWSRPLSFFTLFMALVSFPASGQSSIEEAYANKQYDEVIRQTDSLLLISSKFETARLYQLRADAWYYLGELELSLENYFQAIHAGEQSEIRNDLLLVECYSHAGFCYREMGLYQKAFPHYEQSLSIAKSINDSVESAQQYYNLGTLYQYLGDFENAIKLLDSAYQMDLALKDTVALGFDLGFLSELKFQIGDLDNALYYAKESLVLLPPGGGNANSHANRVKQVGSIFLERGMLDSASFYLEAAEKEYVEIKDQWRLASCWLELAKLKTKERQYSKAVDFAERANAFYTKKGDSQYLILSNNVLAMTYSEMMMLDKAQELLIENQHKCEQLGNIKNLRDNYKLQSELFAKIGDHKAAEEVKLKLQELENSLNEFTNKEQLNRLALQVKFDKLEQENQILIQSNQSTHQRLEDKSSKLVWLTTGGLALFIVLIASFYLVRKNLREKNKRLENDLLDLREHIKVLLEGDASNLQVDLSEINECLSAPLTDREFEILGHAIGDLNNSEIAEKVFVSVNTVKYHLKNIYDKLGVSNRKQALGYVLRKK
ncbi:MAG: tetratricopeptide repeat protein [Reichenbachiella sp.]|uniref:tetratricopeptide repeat protein n=1 Tax=Reichenbachiella sp. TaxID=2184521 RepID=UPI003262EB3D